MSTLFTLEGIKELILWVPVILFSISFHEFSHAWMADRLGDPTARYQGRLTLNPVKHFNLFGFLMMVIVHFGWAEPVPVNPNNFKNPSKGMLATAIAGPVSNLMLAVISSFIYVLGFVVSSFIPMHGEILLEIYKNSMTILLYMMMLNIGLAFFNLIPVYPLDGSRVLAYFLPNKYNEFMYRYGQYVQIFFVLLVVLTPFVGDLIGIVQDAVAGILIQLWSFVFEIVGLI